MTDHRATGESDAPSPPSAGDGDFALNVGDDLLAEALAAVEARTRPRPPDPEEMDAFAADLEIDAAEPLDPDGGDFDLDDDDDDFDVVFESDPSTEAPAEDPVDGDPLDAPELDLEAELSDLQAALDAALDRVDQLEEVAQADRDARAEAEAEVEAERQTLLADKRKAMVLARRWKERAERAEGRLEIARESRDAAAERALKAEAAVQHSEDLREQGLARAAERRRKELAEAHQAAPGKVLAALLPSIDNLRLAMDHAGDDPARVIEGLEMISGQFEAALVRLGVERVAADPGTPFSPELHEAFAQEATDAVPPGAVLREVNAGYRLQGRLLRAARVIVAAAPPVADDPAEAAAADAPPSAEAEPAAHAAEPPPQVEPVSADADPADPAPEADLAGEVADDRAGEPADALADAEAPEAESADDEAPEADRAPHDDPDPDPTPA